MAPAGAMAIVLNAVNEIAVAAFLDRRIGFLDIARLVEDAMDRTAAAMPCSIADVVAIDGDARTLAASLMSEMAA